MAWYYADRGQRKGPVEDPDLDALVRAGIVRDDTLVWQAGMGGWQPHSTVRGAGAAPSAPLGADAARFCAECGRPFPANELVMIGAASVCATCKPIYLQRMREGGRVTSGAFIYAGFWIRFVARLIDGVLLGVVGAVIQAPLNFAVIRPPAPGQDPLTVLPAFLGVLAISSALNIVIAVAYEAYFLSTRGATLGKLALDLKVVRPDGSGITVGRAIGRYFATMVSSMTLLIGYIMAAFDDEKRALHDRICDTRVIRTR